MTRDLNWKAIDALRIKRLVNDSRQVRPGERLVLVGTGLKVRRRLTRFRVVGQVGTEKAFEAVITGVPLGKLEDLRGA